MSTTLTEEPLLIAKNLKTYTTNRPGLLLQLEMASKFPTYPSGYCTIDEMLATIGRGKQVNDREYKLVSHLMYCSHLMQFLAQPPSKTEMANYGLKSDRVYPQDSLPLLASILELLAEGKLVFMAHDLK